jgi:ADP-heptose:LPS heptosyltransferase
MKIFSFFRRTYLFPFKYEVPCFLQFQNKKSLGHFLKFFKRYIYILIKKQNNLELNSINQMHKNILWINMSAKSLGDSLMDLSSRVMLKDKNIDLFTDKKNAHIYLNDSFFDNVYTKVIDIKENKYDLTIIDSYSTRSIKIKSKISYDSAYVGMYGYFNGPEVNRVLFSFHQMNHLLNYKKSEAQINSFAKSSLSISYLDKEIVDNLALEKYITIALGGEWQYRTYNKWLEVVDQLLIEDKELNIILIGSQNANNIATKILSKFPEGNVINFVSKLSFMQTAEVIKRSEILLCCDGGLMHAANAVNVKIIPLFARLTPKMQLTDSVQSFPLFDEIDVNNILVKTIVSKYLEVA